MKRLTTLFLAIALTLTLSGCGGGGSGGGSRDSYAAMDTGMAAQSSAPAAAMPTPAPAEAMDYEAYEEEGYWGGDEKAASDDGAAGSSFAVPEGVKMIYTARLEMQSTEFDTAAADIEKLVGQLGGYFENRSVQDYSSGYRYASYTVRVPAAKFQSLLNQLGTLCHVTYATQSAENITERYYDTQSRLGTAQTKLRRLQELLSQAENMEDIITIESAISETEYEIESLSGTLRHYDALVDYATVEIELREVYKLTDTDVAPKTFGERFVSAFKDGLESFGEFLEDFALWLAYSWLPLLCVVAIVVLLVRVKRKKGIKGPLERLRARRKKAKENAQKGTSGDVPEEK